MWKSSDLDPIEAAKLIATVVGAVILFLTLQSAEARKTDLEALALVQEALPILDNNYTNRLSEDQSHINVRVVHRFKSAVQTYIASPTVRLFSDQKEVSWLDYKTVNREQFSGIFAGGVTKGVEYTIDLCPGVAALPNLEIRLEYFTEMPLAYQNLYKPVLLKLKPKTANFSLNKRPQPEILPAISSCQVRPESNNLQYEHKEDDESNFLNSLWRMEYVYQESVKPFEANPNYEKWGGETFDWM